MATTFQWTDDELASAVADSTSWSQVSLALGYKSRGGKPAIRIRGRVEALGLDVSHFIDPHLSWVTPEHKRERERKWYADHEHRRIAVKARTAMVTERNKRLIISYLKEHPCMDCGVADLRVLDFDHRDPEEKVSEVTRMARSGFSEAKLLAEIEKCDVVCSNCHRIRTAERHGGWRKHLAMFDEA